MSRYRAGIGGAARWWRGLAIALALAVPGCMGPKVSVLLPPKPATTGEVIRRVNANNRRISGVYGARCAMTGRVVGDAGESWPVDLSGPLRARPPRELRLDLRHALASALLVGSNTERYWLRILLDVKKLWWGRHDEGAGDLADMPLIRADQVIEALGISVLPGERSGLLGPLHLVSDDGERDVLIYCSDSELAGLVHVREYHVDRRLPCIIRRIVVRDGFGQVTMQAELSDHATIGEDGPVTARRIALSWPQQGSRLTLRLSGRKLLDVPAERAARLFGFPADPMVRPENVIALDEPSDSWTPRNP